MNKIYKEKIYFICKKLIGKPELVFVILGLVFGLIFIFRLAPLSGTDEFTHFPRLYQISEGVFWEKRLPGNQFGGRLPVNINTMVNRYRNLSRFPTGSSYLAASSQLNAEYARISNPGTKKVSAVFTSVIAYPPWAYLPNLIGLLIAKVLGVSLLWYVYLARISGLLVWLVLTYFAIRLLPSGKWFLTVVALVPTALSQAATISSDGLQMSLVWLLAAMVLAMIVGRLKTNWPILTALVAVAAASALIKDGYFLAGLLPLAIPAYRFASKRSAVMFKVFEGVFIVAIAVLFTLRTVHAVKGVVLTPTYGMYFNSQQQISYILHHLLPFAWHIVEQPFTKVFDTTYLGIVGILTNRLIYLSVLVIGVIYGCLVFSWTHIRPLPELKRNAKWAVPIFLLVGYGTYVLVSTAIYIGNTSVGAPFVNALYGRYFLPVIPLLAVIPMALRRQPAVSRYQPVVVIGSVIGLMAMVMSLQ